MQLCGFHCITWYSICILVIFSQLFYQLYAILCDSQEFLWPRSSKWVQILVFQVYPMLRTNVTLNDRKYAVKTLVLFGTFLVGGGDIMYWLEMTSLWFCNFIFAKCML